MIALPLRMARLCYQFASGKLQCHCGGTLITSQHVLTAYHCTHNRIAADDPDIQRCTKRDVSESRQIGDVTKTGEVVILGRNKLTELDLEQADLIMNPIIGLFVHQKKVVKVLSQIPSTRIMPVYTPTARTMTGQRAMTLP